MPDAAAQPTLKAVGHSGLLTHLRQYFTHDLRMTLCDLNERLRGTGR